MEFLIGGAAGVIVGYAAGYLVARNKNLTATNFLTEIEAEFHGLHERFDAMIHKPAVT